MVLLSLAAVGCRPEGFPPPPDTTETEATHSADPGTTPGVLAFRGARPKNLLMISIDTLRRDHFADYGPVTYQDFFTTWKNGSVHLDDHEQCSNWTYPSTSCTLLGRYHEENGFIPVLRTTGLPFPYGQRTLAARLHDEGYYSMLVSPNGWLSDEWNNAQGYDDQSRPENGVTTTVMQDGLDRVTQAIADGHDRWFLHLHLMEPHAPYTAPLSYWGDELLGVDPLPAGWDLDTDGGHYDLVNHTEDLTPAEKDLLLTHLRARYHGELKYLDDQVEQMIAQFTDAGMLDDTLVVVWNDHGEQFFERDHQSHAWDLNAEENNAFLFFWADNLQPRAWTEPTASVDLVPTVLDALGFPADDPVFSGFVLGQAPSGRPRYAMSVARDGTLQAVTRRGRKLIFDWDDGKVTAFDRDEDPSEMTDRFLATNPEDLALWDLLLPRIALMRELVPREILVWPADLPHPEP
jgi:arylsulfatase A-like enzyme